MSARTQRAERPRPDRARRRFRVGLPGGREAWIELDDVLDVKPDGNARVIHPETGDVVTAILHWYTTPAGDGPTPGEGPTS